MEQDTVEVIRRKGTAASLILAPLIYMIGQALQPDFDASSAAEQLPILIEHQVRGPVAVMLCILGIILFIPAILGLMQLLQTRGAWLGLIGGSLAVGGAVLFACSLTALGLVPFDIADVPESQRPGILPALQALNASGQEGQGAVGAYIGVGFGMFPLGLLLVSIGLWRAGAVPRWAAAILAVGAIGMIGGVNHWIRAVDAAVLLVGMSTMGVHMLRAMRPAVAPARSEDITGMRPAHP